jgi:hypothetical protein
MIMMFVVAQKKFNLYNLRFHLFMKHMSGRGSWVKDIPQNA